MHIETINIHLQNAGPAAAAASGALQQAMDAPNSLAPYYAELRKKAEQQHQGAAAMRDRARHLVRMTEQHHGITGGQHG